MVAKAVKTKKRDATIALRAADAFLQHSKQFTNSLPEDLGQAANIAVRDMGGFIASVTTLAFATELYLKSLLVRFTDDIPPNIRFPGRYLDCFFHYSTRVILGP